MHLSYINFNMKYEISAIMWFNVLKRICSKSNIISFLHCFIKSIKSKDYLWAVHLFLSYFNFVFSPTLFAWICAPKAKAEKITFPKQTEQKHYCDLHLQPAPQTAEGAAVLDSGSSPPRSLCSRSTWSCRTAPTQLAMPRSYKNSNNCRLA